MYRERLQFRDNLFGWGRVLLIMQRLKLLSLAGFLMALPAFAEIAVVGDNTPQWSIRDIDGEKVRYPKDVKDSDSIVLFWTTWCPYCKALMPELKSLQTQAGVENLPVFALQLDQESVLAESEMYPNFRFAENAWDVADAYGVTTVPAVFVVRKGKLIYVLDYPDSEHPSQSMPHGSGQAALLAQWWSQRLQAVLAESAEMASEQ
ncbi:MAG: hypothetical protein DHS20C11_05620 [Lysobacteraceae bacterium]|nr:MAG: hypothetical protein DHS20C11_05620 [Xanthomonadaceae bacterium]